MPTPRQLGAGEGEGCRGRSGWDLDQGTMAINIKRRTGEMDARIRRIGSLIERGQDSGPKAALTSWHGRDVELPYFVSWELAGELGEMEGLMRPCI